MNLVLALWLALSPVWAAPGPSAGVEPEQESGLIPGLPPGVPPAPDQIDALSHELATGLRCPVCQGLSVADSTSAAAVAFQRRIRELVSLGYTPEQITDYFVDRYGEWILLEPPPHGLNWIVWLGPGLAAGLGLAWVASVTMEWRKEPDEVPLPSDQGLVPRDKYEERLLAELED